ncbi:AAA family ATPase [Catenovulum sp. SM1970]|uniref:AAA family ATPase n=1 Tax=Marinifaba aquimaris TaxID=2741323 RepID=UPI00157427D3|nr:AAA family ATPase [Marinifaba aquimaris]NTS76507.1 AAA family ATPase [Marinifaba aquimaris]
MSNPLIEALQQGLKSSPDNDQLQQALVEAYINDNQFEPALELLQQMLAKAPTNIELLERTIALGKQLERADLLLAYQALLDIAQPKQTDNEITPEEQATEVKAVEQSAATIFDTESDKVTPINTKRVRGSELKLVSSDQQDYSVDDLCEDTHVYLDDVGGMEDVKKRLRISFLAPLQNPELVKQYGKSVGGGLILYGPPGCGKTFIARALAGELGAKFVSVGLSDILDMYVGESERKLHEIFESARRNSPCVLFIDELDALGQKRSNLKNSGMRTLVNQLLNEMDSVNNNNENLFVLGATNHPWEIDEALKRPGRFDRMIPVFPPDEAARQAILNYHLKNAPTDTIDIESLVRQTRLFSGADLAHLCQSAIDQVFERSLASQQTEKITERDFSIPLKEVNPSALSWFETAKNYAMFSNKNGQYDDIMQFIKVNKL